jgi:TRAP-type mannitol/chloroaromatic compound transport system substrate-binding protein
MHEVVTHHKKAVNTVLDHTEFKEPTLKDIYKNLDEYRPNAYSSMDASYVLES